jgi:hypothetical protein
MAKKAASKQKAKKLTVGTVQPGKRKVNEENNRTFNTKKWECKDG